MRLNKYQCLGFTLIFALLLVAPSITAQSQTATPPALKVGEFWTWQWNNQFQNAKHNGTYTRTVVRMDKFEGQDAYILSRGDGTFAVWNSDITPLAAIDGAGNVKFRQVRNGDPVFPLSVGRVITRHIDNPEDKYRGDYKYTVTGVGEVQTAAGTFNAFSVTFEGAGTNYEGSSFTVKGTQYYAPAAKQWVKTSWSTNRGRSYSEELVSYQVLP